MLLRSVMLFGFLLSFYTSFGQNVLQSFNRFGCPTDSVELVIKDQYSYAKFIINDGEKDFWANSYTTYYRDVEKIKVRAFYANGTEDIADYTIRIQLNQCKDIFENSNQCYGSEIVEVVPEDFDSIGVKITNVEGFDSQNYKFYASGDTIRFTLGRKNAIVTYRIYLEDYASSDNFSIVTPQIIDLPQSAYCEGQVVTFRSCTENSNLIWKELSGIAGNNDMTGSTFTFEMRQSDVSIEVTDPELNWTQEYLIEHREAQQIDFIKEVNISCDGTEVVFNDIGPYRIRLYPKNDPIFEYYNYNEYFGYDINIFDDDKSFLTAIDTVITSNSFVIDADYIVGEMHLLVDLKQNTCHDYEILLLSYDPLDDQILNDLPENLFDSGEVSEVVSGEFVIESWKAYNIIEVSYLYNTFYGFLGSIFFLLFPFNNLRYFIFLADKRPQ